MSIWSGHHVSFIRVETTRGLARILNFVMIDVNNVVYEVVGDVIRDVVRDVVRRKEKSS